MSQGSKPLGQLLKSPSSKQDLGLKRRYFDKFDNTNFRELIVNFENALNNSSSSIDGLRRYDVNMFNDTIDQDNFRYSFDIIHALLI